MRNLLAFTALSLTLIIIHILFLGYLPHFAALVISAVTGPTSITREHLGLSVALNIPVFIVVTKIDAVTTSACNK